MSKKRHSNEPWLVQVVSGFFIMIWYICKGVMLTIKGVFSIIASLLIPSKNASKSLRKPVQSSFTMNINPDDSLLELTPVEFEQYVGKLFEAYGYRVRETPSTGDNGVDLYIENDEVFGIVQCKRYNNSSTVGEPVLRDLYGTMFAVGANVAYLVTTGKFSRQAFKFSEGKPIKLIDGQELEIWRKEAEASNDGKAIDAFVDSIPILPLIIFALIAITIGLLGIAFFRL